MTLWEAIRVALTGVGSNKLRSGLTCLGVIIGVGAVIAMVAMGQGAAADVQDRIRGFGTNLLTVWPGQARKGRLWGGVGSRESLTPNDSLALADDCPSVLRTTPGSSTTTQIKYGNANTFTSVEGASPDFSPVRNHYVTEGRFFNESENRALRKVAVIGARTKENLFPNEDPLGKRIQIRKMRFEVIGVLEEKGGASHWRDPDDLIVVPINTFLSRIAQRDFVDRIYVEAASEKHIPLAQAEVEQVLRKRHRIRSGADDDFNVRTQTEILDTFSGTAQTFTKLLAGIAAVSLLVGGIGIMNIMLVSVTERTREIGIRKALGGTRRDILVQFLVESVVLSVIGGAVGIGLGLGGAKAISHFAGWRTMVSPQSIIMAFSFAAGVGVFFGLYPAQKAAAMDPIESLRYE